MSDDHSVESRNPFALPATPGEKQPAPTGPGSLPLPQGWHRLPTRLRHAWLYRIRLPFGVSIHWEAGVMLNGALVHRRFASELHARAWLSMAVEPISSQNPFNMEELNGPYRIAALLRGGKALGQV